MTATETQSEPKFLLAITEANHERDEFYSLGGAGFDTEQERAENITRISRDLDGHACAQASRCYMLDVLGVDGWSLIDGFEISERTAHQLLGVDDFEPLRQQQDADIKHMLDTMFPERTNR
jgi:hypothetical protein